MSSDGYDDTAGAYVGPCPDCGTAHDGWLGPESFGGRMICLRTQAEALARPELAGRIDITIAWMHLAQANALGLPSDLDLPLDLDGA